MGMYELCLNGNIKETGYVVGKFVARTHTPESLKRENLKYIFKIFSFYSNNFNYILINYAYICIVNNCLKYPN